MEVELFDVGSIATPTEKCLKVGLGIPDPNLVATAELSRYDHLMVANEQNLPVGILSIRSARLCVSQMFRVEDLGSDIWTHELQRYSPVGDILEKLSAVGAVIVRNSAADGSNVAGLLTVSDLNRARFRFEVYPIVAQLELNLSNFIEAFVPDPWTWIDSLSDDKQVRVIGRWEVERRKHVDTSPINSLTLSELINIIGKIPKLYRMLGYESGKKFTVAVKGFVDVRNQVMHPVRPLVVDSAAVKLLRVYLANMEQMMIETRDIIET